MPRLTVAVHKPQADARPHRFRCGPLELPRYERGSMEATRRAYAEALVALGRARGEIVALDGDVDNSTYTELFEAALPERYFEMYIAEQQMAAAAVGLQVRGWIPFASTYGAFWSRAFDFIRMAAVSRANIRLAGSHAGVDIGPDGPSQMGLEDIASFRTIWGSTVLYPSDANQAAQLVARWSIGPASCTSGRPVARPRSSTAPTRRSRSVAARSSGPAPPTWSP